MFRQILKALLVFLSAFTFSACTVTAPAANTTPPATAADVPDPTAIPVTQAGSEFDCASVTEIPAAECRALASFYEATAGQEWLDSSGWLDTTTPCSWLGVTCAAGHVDTLAIFFNNLQGQLPPSLSELSQLRVLDLHNNALEGRIPPEYGRLQNLQSIDLSVNQISGPIPPALGDLRALQSLNLVYNQLNGPLPEAIGQLTSLRNLDLSYNGLEGELPASLADLSALESLRLRANQFTGEVPFALAELPVLGEIDLTFNKLHGTVPSALFQLPVHRLWGNDFEGTIYAAADGPQDVNYLGAAFAFTPDVANTVWPELAPARPAEPGPGLMWAPGEHILFTLVSSGAPGSHAPLGLYLPPEAQILIFPTAGLNAEVQPIVDTLHDLLADPSELAAYETTSAEAGAPQPELPMLPPSNALQAFQAQIEPLAFAEGSGIRYLTMLSQGPVPISNQDLFYTFQGLTADGTTYVAAYFPVSFPDLPDSPQIAEEEMLALMNDWQGYIQQNESVLNEQPASAFTPDLAALDALVASLSVAGTTPLPMLNPVWPEGEAAVDSQPVLQWEPFSGAAEYHIVVLDDAAFPPQVFIDQMVTEPLLQVETPLAPGHYSWTVWAVGENGELLAELNSSFTVTAE